MELIDKILELEIEESKKKELLKIAQNYEKKSGFFAGILALILLGIIAAGGFWFAKFHQFSYTLKPLESEIVLAEKTWWGLFEHEQIFTCNGDKIIQKK
ncbi:hypothetical protein [Geothermobacter ehrlichii]|uniref:hypothetical protein n=1 Tax=Geothermobacter ehrlichii TaxID=213224 RepID=UPI0011E7A556|nr:hypothetical protein [Geothermobacter ehrlichii]